MGRYYW